MALLWRLCKNGHPQMPHNVQFERSRSYIQSQCRLCRSELRRLNYARNKAKQEWLNQNYIRRQGGSEIPARRTAVDTDKTKATVVMSAKANACDFQVYSTY